MANAAKQQNVVPARRGPRTALPKLEEEMERFFASPFLHTKWPGMFDWQNMQSSLGAEMPSVNIIDREDEVCVRAELPGFKKKDIEVSVNHDSLTIKAQTSKDETEEEGEYYRREMSQGFVARTVALPTEVDGDKAKANLEDGVLEVKVPKLATAKRQRVKID